MEEFSFLYQRWSYMRIPKRSVFLLSGVMWLTLAQEKIHAAPCPCDIYAGGGTPCVAAHSTVRALYSSYNGPLYQVRRTSDNQTRDIGVLTAGGIANAATQESFLGTNAGTISKIYDQSPNGNHLVRSPRGGWMKVPAREADAKAAQIKVNGYTVYGVYTFGNGFSSDTTVTGAGYRNNATTGVVTGNNAEGMYMVCSGRHYNQWCCFDYGNAQTNNLDNGNATMECIYFGNSTQWGHGSGAGPWVMSDPENGLQAGVDQVAGSKIWAGNTPINADFVTGALKSKSTNFWDLRGGSAQSGTLKTMYSGIQFPGWYPKKLEGAIVLGVGGDNSNTGEGTFFEGAMVSGFPTDTTLDSVQANIVAAGYGRTTSILYGARDAATASMFKVHYNPSTAKAVISYTLQDARRVSMSIVDQQGRQIAAIVNGTVSAGRHEAVWNAKRVPAGVYICRIAIDGMEGWTGKIIVGK
jgi:non-reducing end alpha-L-arabinofuranosidase